MNVDPAMGARCTTAFSILLLCPLLACDARSSSDDGAMMALDSMPPAAAVQSENSTPGPLPGEALPADTLRTMDSDRVSRRATARTEGPAPLPAEPRSDPSAP